MTSPEHGSVTHAQSSTAQSHPLGTSGWVCHSFGCLEPCLKPIPGSVSLSCSELQPAWEGGQPAMPCLPLAPSMQPLCRASPAAGTPWPCPHCATPRAGLQHLQSAQCHAEGAGGSQGSLAPASGIGAGQPQGNSLEIPPWALSRTAQMQQSLSAPFLLFWHSSASLPSHTAARDTQGPVSLSLCSASSLCLAPPAAGCSWSGHSLPCTAIPQAAGRHSFLSWQQHKPFPSSGQACQSLPSNKNTTQPHPERLCSPAIVPPHHTMAKMCPCPTHCGTAAQQG